MTSLPAFAALGFFLASLPLALRPARRGLLVVGVLPFLWTMAAAAVSTLLVAELGDHPLAAGGRLGLPASAWGACALAAVPVAFFPLRWRWRAAAVLALGLALFGFGDVLYLRFFGTIAPPEAARTLHQAWDVAGIAWDLTEARDRLFLLPAAAALAVGIPRRRLKPASRGRWALAWGAGLVPLMLALPAVAEVRRELAAPDSRVQMDLAQKLDEGFLHVHLFEFLRAFQDRAARPPLPPEALVRVRELTARRGEEAAAVPYFGAAAGANVLLVQVEALSHWVVGTQVEGRAVAPFLEQLSRTARYYPRILDQTSDGRTSDAEYTVLNSLHPLPRGAVAYVHGGNRFVALPGRLRERGYATFSAHAYKRGFWNRSRLHPAYGFERSWFRRELGGGERIAWGLADHLFFERVTDELRTLPRPFLGFLVTLSTHPPYEGLPPGHEALPVGPLEGTPLGQYLQLVHYFDGALGSFFEELERQGLLEETLVVVYGDHTAEGFDPERLRRISGAGEREPLPAALSFVPLFLYVPGEAGEELAGTAMEVGGFLDVAPTVLHLLGEERPASFLGRPLLPGGVDFATRWRGKEVVGQGKISVNSKCKTLEEWQRRPRSACRELRLEGEEERRVSHLITIYDLARELGP